MEVVHNSPFSNITESEARSYETFPCLCQRRSSRRPGVVGEVTLHDIDIIGAIGDSDTAAFAANSRGLDYFTEYWGSSFVTGKSGETTETIEKRLHRLHTTLLL